MARPIYAERPRQVLLHTQIGLKMTTQAGLICQSHIRWDMQSGLGSQVFEVIGMASHGYAE
jgi:hypothetical protein